MTKTTNNGTELTRRHPSRAEWLSDLGLSDRTTDGELHERAEDTNLGYPDTIAQTRLLYVGLGDSHDPPEGWRGAHGWAAEVPGRTLLRVHWAIGSGWLEGFASRAHAEAALAWWVGPHRDCYGVRIHEARVDLTAEGCHPSYAQIVHTTPVAPTKVHLRITQLAAAVASTGLAPYRIRALNAATNALEAVLADAVDLRPEGAAADCYRLARDHNLEPVSHSLDVLL